MNKLMILLLAVPIVLMQGAWIFFDARKRGESYYLIWGLFGLINFPASLIIYLLVTRSKEAKCGSCGRTVRKSYNICPYCGTNLRETCKNCGSEIKEGFLYCPNCSKKI